MIIGEIDVIINRACVLAETRKRPECSASKVTSSWRRREGGNQSARPAACCGLPAPLLLAPAWRLCLGKIKAGSPSARKSNPSAASRSSAVAGDNRRNLAGMLSQVREAMLRWWPRA